MRLAVVGGTGFVGREIVRQALDHGHQVRVIARSGINVPTGAHFIPADVRDAASLQPALQDTDVVINAAGLAHRPVSVHRDQYDAVNTSGACAVVTAATSCGARRLVMLSSIAVYGGSSHTAILDEHHTPAPSSPYAWSKLNGELMAQQAAATSELPLTVLRLATVYGASDPGNFVRLIQSVRAGTFVWIGDGTNRKTVMHRSDVARACLIASADTTQTSATFNLTDDIYTVRQIVTTITELAQRRIGRVGIPLPAAKMIIRIARHGGSRGRAIANTLERWLADDAYSGDAFRKRYDFSPLRTLRDGLMEEIEWLRRTG